MEVSHKELSNNRIIEKTKEQMTLNDYQKQAMTTCMESSNNFSYMMLNLVGEVGEFASKVAKAIRKEQNVIELNDWRVCGISGESIQELQENNNLEALGKIVLEDNVRDAELQKEAGDILWQLAGLCSVMGWSLEDVARQNLDKLASRQKRNVIDGNGDNR